MSDPTTTLESILDEHLEVAAATRASLIPTISELAAQIIEAFEGEGKLIVFGNGGSAADAQHFAGELTGHYKRDRRALPAIALTTDTSVLTAIANDYGYEDVFARQVEALCGVSDVVVGISTSGNAANVIRGITTARAQGARTWALTGAGGGRLAEVAEHVLRVPSDATARIQEMHITVIHAVSELVDAYAAAGQADPHLPAGQPLRLAARRSNTTRWPRICRSQQRSGKSGHFLPSGGKNLPERLRVQHDQAGDEDRDEQCPDDGADHGAAATEQAHASDDYRRDR